MSKNDYLLWVKWLIMWVYLNRHHFLITFLSLLKLDSNCFCYSCKDLDERPFNSRVANNQLEIPTAMIALDVWLPPSSFVDKWGLIDVGQLGPAGRLYYVGVDEDYNITSSHFKHIFWVNTSLFRSFTHSSVNIGQLGRN